jgi:hypothetical protein
LLDRLTGGALRDHLTKQYILAGRRGAPGFVQGAFDWLIV